MRVVLCGEDPRRLGALLRSHGLQESIDLSGAGAGTLVVVVFARSQPVSAVAAEWLRAGAQPDAFIIACTHRTRSNCQPESCWSAQVCDLVVAATDDTLLGEVALRLNRIEETDGVLTSDWLTQRAVGDSPVWRKTLRAITEIGRFGSGNCLLLGESGCGKELLARLVHDLDKERRSGPFVVVDCTTLNPELSGSELFGHVKGAFTHALTARDGAVALADRGTLFLDEVGELELPLQARLLRVIQEHMYKRVGEDNWRQSNFRLVCATNRNLEADVAAGRFRADLYFRIAQWMVRAPTLAERREDIPLLVRHFLSQQGGSVPEVMPEVMRRLVDAEYRGNVRELRNVVLRIADRQRGFRVLSTACLDEPCVNTDALSATLDWERVFANAVEGALNAGLGLKNIGQLAESLAVEAAARRAGSTGRTAELLQITPRALQLRRQGRGAQAS